jgi:O-antigen/teichoic acid export membrane protein
VVRAFFGAAYVPAAPALAVLTAGLFVRALVGLNGDVAKAIDRPKIELRSVAVAVVVDVALNAVLIPRYGIVGAAAATAAGYAVYNLVEVVAIHRAVGSHPFAAATLVPLGPTLVVAVGIDALVVGPVGLSGLVGIGLVLVVVHLGSMALTGSLDESDRLLARRLDERLGTDLARLVALFDRD